jgi:hypothetical protein
MPIFIPKNGCGNTDGYSIAASVQNVHCFIDDWATGSQSLSQGTSSFANTGPKDLAAWPANSIVTLDAGDLLRRPIERSDSPLLVHGENTIGDRIQDGISKALGVKIFHFKATGTKDYPDYREEIHRFASICPR